MGDKYISLEHVDFALRNPNGVDPQAQATLSIAISLKRIADTMTPKTEKEPQDILSIIRVLGWDAGGSRAMYLNDTLRILDSHNLIVVSK